MRRGIWLLVLVATAGLVAPGTAHAKPPKKCAGLVESTAELSDLLDDYFDTLDEFFSAPPGHPSETRLIGELSSFESELGSMDRLIERDLEECEARRGQAEDAALAASRTRPPKRCAALVESTGEITDLLDEYLATLNAFFTSTEGDPGAQGLFAELDRLDSELRSIDRILERDIRECEGS
jgi:hypothetical protein